MNGRPSSCIGFEESLLLRPGQERNTTDLNKMSLTLDPEYLQAIEPYMPILSQAPKLEIGDVASRRRGTDGLFDLIMPAWPVTTDVEYTAFSVKAEDGFKIPVHRLVKKGTSTSTQGPAVFYAHGGGYFALSFKHYRKVLEHYVSLSGVPFFIPDYRLAPEHPFPTPINDCYSALQWLFKGANELNVDASRIGLLGDSAGGGLAAGLAIKARDEKLSPPPARQMLIGSMLDDRSTATRHPEIDQFATWSTDDNITGWGAYLGSAEKVNSQQEDAVHPYAAPGRVKSVTGLPKLYLEVPDIDVFRDENLAYASRVAAEDIETEVHVWTGVPHSFELFSPNSTTTQIAIQCRIRCIRKL